MTTKRNVFWAWTYLVVSIGLTSLAPGRGHAEAGGAYEESVQQAVVEFKAGNFEEAHALFLDAHAIKPNARTWRSLGVCAFELRLYVEAATDLEAALADPRKALTAEQRTEATQLLAKSRAFVSAYELRLTPETASVEVDGKPPQLRGETLLLDPGRHLVVVSAPGYVEQRVELRTGAGVKDELAIELVAVTPAEPAAPAKSAAAKSVAARRSNRRREETPARHGHPWTWSLSAGAVAATAVAVVLRLRVNSLSDEFASCTEQRGNCEPTRQRGEDLLLGSRLTGALAGGLALGAIAAFFIEHSKRGSPLPRASLSVGPRSLVVRGTF